MGQGFKRDTHITGLKGQDPWRGSLAYALASILGSLMSNLGSGRWLTKEEFLHCGVLGHPAPDTSRLAMSVK